MMNHLIVFLSSLQNFIKLEKILKNYFYDQILGNLKRDALGTYNKIHSHFGSATKNNKKVRIQNLVFDQMDPGSMFQQF